MQAYFVRMNAQQSSPHEIVGIFVAETLGQLMDMVDECVDPDRVDYMSVGVGGIYWSHKVDYHFPIRPGRDRDSLPGFPKEGELCEWWLSPLFDANKKKWKPLFERAMAE